MRHLPPPPPTVAFIDIPRRVLTHARPRFMHAIPASTRRRPRIAHRRTPVLSQITFMLSVGVVCACFVSTKVLVPAVMAIFPTNVNFWPRFSRSSFRRST